MIPIAPVFEAYGGRVTRWKSFGWSGAFCCLPDHEDRNASAQLNEERGRFRCLVCAVNYNAAELVQAVEGCSFRAAKARAIELAGGSDGSLPSEPVREGSLLPPRSGDRRPRNRYIPPWRNRQPDGRP